VALAPARDRGARIRRRTVETLWLEAGILGHGNVLVVLARRVPGTGQRARAGARPREMRAPRHRAR
jgi:hypothetical protein